MKIPHARRTAGVASLALVATLGGTVALTAHADETTAPAAAVLPTTGLNILLTNDDGWDAPGITAVHDALEAAGHTVTLVAPATNQSGVSARVDFSGNLTALEQQPGAWSVSTSPAGTVLFGLDQLFDEKPDLVVSGTNVGSNTGFDTNFSGTIGAATVAAGMFDIPSVAISTATGYGAGATGAYAETADLLVDMLAQGLPDLDRGHVINVNYPQLSAERPAPLGIRYAANSQASAAAFTYVPQADPGVYKIQGARGTETPLPGTDTAVLAQGYVTVGVLDADRSVAIEDADAVTALIEKLGGDPAPQPETVDPWVQVLPARAAAGSTQWLRLRGIEDNATVQFVWTPVRKGAKVTTTARAAADLVKLKAPRRKATYKVAVRVGGKTLRTGRITLV
ncbi:MAG: 5'/3'-nucleotidase SurE [Nocardioides sp.]|uniref:5'/3'-nucleotidase SurE n=1 Tax=Nocardioides sp. TaxID=35761 RepID=UPI003F060CAA